jgi:aminoglycoside phosphotransferase (APT) family kinase protein
LNDDVAALAARALVAQAPHEGAARIENLQRLTAGANRETWSVDAVLPSGERRPLILRRGEFGVEVAALRAAAAAGAPVPPVVHAGDDPPYVLMERLEGETIARRILRDDAYADARPLMAGQCGEILARIHSIPLDEVPGLERVDLLGSLSDRLARFEEASPPLELALRWLEANQPPPSDPVVVHGDFRNGNLMVGPEGIRAVLDWEQVHVGDPMEDFGHLCARVWRFGGAGPVGGFGDYDDLFGAYERAGGRPIDRDAQRWWELRAAVWWGIGCMEMASRHLAGEVRSVELAAIGRRAWEQEYDAMLLLAEELGVA